MDPEMVLALQEVDALTPETPPVAPVQGPEPDYWGWLLAARQAQSRDQSILRGCENSRRSAWDNPEQMANVAGQMVSREAFLLGNVNAQAR